MWRIKLQVLSTKKILSTLVLSLLISCLAFSQNEHGIKVGANFATIKTNENYGSDISTLLGPAIYYEFRSLGDHWGYFMDLGYSQSGFKEVYQGNQSTLKVGNIDWIPIGIQYSFLTDWSKIRPILQASLGGRASVHGTVVTPYGSHASGMDEFFDVLWSLGGGITSGKHMMINLSYGGGLLKVISSDEDWKNKQYQLEFTYFF